jgi:hypothetical protein
MFEREGWAPEEGTMKKLVALAALSLLLATSTITAVTV